MALLNSRAATGRPIVFPIRRPRGPFPVILSSTTCVAVGTASILIHLEPVTNGENLLRGQGPTAMRAAQTACINGHPFTEENTYRPKSGGRDCRECKRVRDRGYRRARSP